MSTPRHLMNEFEKLAYETAIEAALEGYAAGRLRYSEAWVSSGLSPTSFKRHLRKRGITPRTQGGTPLQDWPELTAAIEGYASGELALKEAWPMTGRSCSWFCKLLGKRGLKRRKKNNP